MPRTRKGGSYEYQSENALVSSPLNDLFSQLGLHKYYDNFRNQQYTSILDVQHLDLDTLMNKFNMPEVHARRLYNHFNQSSTDVKKNQLQRLFDAIL